MDSNYTKDIENVENVNEVEINSDNNKKFNESISEENEKQNQTEIFSEDKTTKKSFGILNIVLGIVSILGFAISILCIVLFLNLQKGKLSPQEAKAILADSTSISLGTIAYINTDSLFLNYKYSIKLNEDLLTEKAKMQKNMEAKYRALQIKYDAFMEKARLGTFVSQSSMDSQQQEIIEEQQRLQKMEEDLNQKLLEKQVKLNVELLDTVVNFLKEYNSNGKYSMILNNAVILYGHQGMDITKDVTDILNQRYKIKAK